MKKELHKNGEHGEHAEKASDHFQIADGGRLTGNGLQEQIHQSINQILMVSIVCYAARLWFSFSYVLCFN
ncbi:MAG: hypothetical protein A2Y62_10570 [Candidatus Fischerbacteria bacterium RBG_13_37_8]|uniref:Uncharacterized protein n=1 Tax=Candidatus Fischerbacteria bacterium RBG_13_37_8 TaxID=1817863 RepID=A0A1F5VTW1_9BACT|nr:MAG: hypothetical protein A2Y62_10570 [Candidatus Fischerbacteria bacterium RBG_13_37_8]